MLVLTRKPGQTIRIGQDTVVTVCKLNHGEVRIGITAPRDVRVVRGELAKKE